MLVLVAVVAELSVDDCELAVLVVAPVASVDVVFGAFCPLVDEHATATGMARTVSETKLWNFMCEPEEALQSFRSQAEERSQPATRNSQSAADSIPFKVFPDDSNYQS